MPISFPPSSLQTRSTAGGRSSPRMRTNPIALTLMLLVLALGFGIAIASGRVIVYPASVIVAVILVLLGLQMANRPGCRRCRAILGRLGCEESRA